MWSLPTSFFTSATSRLTSHQFTTKGNVLLFNISPSHHCMLEMTQIVCAESDMLITANVSEDMLWLRACMNVHHYICVCHCLDDCYLNSVYIFSRELNLSLRPSRFTLFRRYKPDVTHTKCLKVHTCFSSSVVFSSWLMLAVWNDVRVSISVICDGNKFHIGIARGYNKITKQTKVVRIGHGLLLV